MKRVLCAVLTLAMIAALSIGFLSTSAADHLVNDNPTKIKLTTADMQIFNGEYVPAEDSEGVTIWLRVEGLEEAFKLVGGDGHFYSNFSDEKYGGDFWLRNHGQDGIRNAEWLIDQNGDYLMWIPFKYYTLNQQFLGKNDDYITKIAEFSYRALEVSEKNAKATISFMGFFDGKVEGYNTTFKVGETEVTKEGTYTYNNAALTTYEDTGRGLTGNATAGEEFYDEETGACYSKWEDKAAGTLTQEWTDAGYDAEDTIDFTDTIESTWTYAYAGTVLDDRDVEIPLEGDEQFFGWLDENGNTMIPAGSNKLTADVRVPPSTCVVTFLDEDGKELAKEEIDIGTSAADKAPKPTKTSDKDYLTYTFKGWDKDITNCTEDMTVTAVYEATFKNTFTDLKEKDWFYSAAEWALTNRHMSGTSTDANVFSPQVSATRGMLVQVLYNIEGRPDVSDLKNPFTDVAKGQWYTDAVIWAYNNKVVAGVTSTTYEPLSSITREQFTTILYRYAKDVKKYDVSYDTKISLSIFADKNSIESYAQEPIKFGIDTGFISGSKDNGVLNMNPKKGTTRAEMASMIMRFMEAEHTPAK